MKCLVPNCQRLCEFDSAMCRHHRKMKGRGMDIEVPAPGSKDWAEAMANQNQQRIAALNRQGMSFDPVFFTQTLVASLIKMLFGDNEEQGLELECIFQTSLSENLNNAEAQLAQAKLTAGVAQPQPGLIIPNSS